jgi:hypothetical protein
MMLTEEATRAKIDEIVFRVPFEHRLDFLNFVLDGTASPEFYELLGSNRELLGLLNELVTLLEHSFGAVMEVVALDTFAKQMGQRSGRAPVS